MFFFFIIMSRYLSLTVAAKGTLNMELLTIGDIKKRAFLYCNIVLWKSSV